MRSTRPVSTATQTRGRPAVTRVCTFKRSSEGRSAIEPRVLPARFVYEIIFYYPAVVGPRRKLEPFKRLIDMKKKKNKNYVESHHLRFRGFFLRISKSRLEKKSLFPPLFPARYEFRRGYRPTACRRLNIVFHGP